MREKLSSAVAITALACSYGVVLSAFASYLLAQEIRVRVARAVRVFTL